MCPRVLISLLGTVFKKIGWQIFGFNKLMLAPVSIRNLKGLVALFTVINGRFPLNVPRQVWENSDFPDLRNEIAYSVMKDLPPLVLAFQIDLFDFEKSFYSGNNLSSIDCLGFYFDNSLS